MQFLNRREGFFDWQCGGGVPVGGGNPFDRLEHSDPLRVGENGILFVPFHETIDNRIAADRRRGLHDAPFVRGGDNEPVAGRYNEVAAGSAVAAAGNPVEKIGFPQIGDAGKHPDDFAIHAPNRHRHAEYRLFDPPPLDRTANVRSAGLKRRPDVVAVDEIFANAPGRTRHIGHGGSVHARSKHPAIKEAVQNKPLLQEFLQPVRPRQRFRVNGGSHLRQAFQPYFQLAIHLRCNVSDRRHLLLAEQPLHVLAQNPARVE